MSTNWTGDEQEQLDYEKELRIYFLKCILMEGSKVILFFFAFWKLGLVREYWMALLVLMLVRNNGGGIHCRHYISCLAVSFAVLYASILIPCSIHLPVLCSVPILLVCACLGYRLVPIVSESRPEPSPELIRRSKRNTVIVISAFCILICIRPYNLYLNIGVWTIIIHILQLLIAKYITEEG